MERLPDINIPGLGVFPFGISEKTRLAGKATEEELSGLLKQPAGTPLEEVGRAARAAYVLGVKNPLRVTGAALESAQGALGRGLGELKKGFGVVPAPAVQPDRVPSTANPGSAAPPAAEIPTETMTTIVDRPPSIQAFKDAQGRTTFTNQPDSYKGQQEISYDAATAALRPEGRQAGGVSSPTALDAQGRVLDMERPTVELARKKEGEELAHRALVQQLQDQANPQVKVQRDMEAATQIANIFTPEEADIQAQVEQAFKTAQAARPDIPPEALRQLVEQGIRNRIRDNRQAAIQEYLNKERYPGSTLSGYGGQLRGEAADITSR